MAKSPQKNAPEVADPTKQKGPEVKDPKAGQHQPAQRAGGPGAQQPEAQAPARGPAEDSVFSERDAEMREEQQPPRKSQPRPSEL
jgi:hypothetical protein